MTFTPTLTPRVGSCSSIPETAHVPSDRYLSSGPMGLLPFPGTPYISAKFWYFPYAVSCGTSPPLTTILVRLLPKLLPCFRSFLSLHTRTNLLCQRFLPLWVSPPASLASLGFHPSSPKTRRTEKVVAPVSQRSVEMQTFQEWIWACEIRLCSLINPLCPYCSTTCTIDLSSQLFFSSPIEGGAGSISLIFRSLLPAQWQAWNIFWESKCLVLIK